MKTNLKQKLAATAGLLVFAGVASTAGAQATDAGIKTAFATGFEAPAYVAGWLTKQDNWTVDPPLTTPDAAIIQSDRAHTGSQAVRMSAEMLGCVSAEWSRPIGYRPTALNPIVDVEWVMLVSGQVMNSNWSMNIYDSGGACVSSMIVRGLDGLVMYWTSGPEPASTAVIAQRDAWNHFRIRMDYANQVATFYLNGVALDLNDGVPAPALKLGGLIDHVGIGVAGAGVDSAYLDDLMITTHNGVCYANCDGSLIAPLLNVNDFICFQNAFVVGMTLPPEKQVGCYANCDGSIDPPVLNVNDFFCFMNQYSVGCP